MSLTTNNKTVAIDHSKFFIPEKFTPLYYTSIYSDLSDKARLRFNQLYGLYFNEQFIFFESNLSKNFLGSLLKMDMYKDLQQDIEKFIKDESIHTAMFQKLNRACNSIFYRDSDTYFINIRKPWLRLFHSASKHPALFPMFIWLIMMQEEKAIYYSHGFETSQSDLEPQFKRVYVQHMEDEIEHCACDQRILERLWHQKRVLSRYCNAWLFSWMFREFFTAPRRSGIKVIEIWLSEFPDLQHLKPSLLKHFRNLDTNVDFLMMMYGPESIPKSRQALNKWPEFHKLLHYLDPHKTPLGVKI